MTTKASALSMARAAFWISLPTQAQDHCKPWPDQAPQPAYDPAIPYGLRRMRSTVPFRSRRDSMQDHSGSCRHVRTSLLVRQAALDHLRGLLKQPQWERAAYLMVRR